MAATYLTPGVYVEEVPSGSATLSAGATAVAAFVGFTAKAPKDDPADPDGLKPRLVTNWLQFEELYGGFVPGAMLPHSVYGYFNNGGSMAYIVRVPHTEPSKEPGQLALASGDRALGPALEFTTVEPNADVSVSVTPEPPAADAGDDTPPTYRVDVVEGRETVESFPGVTLGGAADTINKTSTTREGRNQDRRRSARCRSAHDPNGDPFDRAGAGHSGRGARSGVRRIRVRAHRHQRTDDRRGRHDGHRSRPRHGGHQGGRHDRPRPVEVGAAGADQPLRRSGQPYGRARLPARHEPAADQGVAQRHGDVRLAVRDAVLPVGQGVEPGRHERRHRDHGAALRSPGRDLGPHRRHPRRVEGAGQRGRPRRARRRGRRSPRPSRGCSTRSASTASARSAPRASGCGAPARWRRTPTGRTSTCAGCST